VRLGQSLLEDLHLHGLATEEPFQFAHSLLEPADLGVADDSFIRPHSRRASLRHQPPPSIQQVRRNAVTPRHRGNRLPRLQALFDDPQLLFRRPASTTGRSGDQFDPLVVVRHEHVLEDIPKPPALRRLSGRNGGQFTHEAGGDSRINNSSTWYDDPAKGK